MKLLVAAAVTLAAAGPPTRRFAIVVGNDSGAGAHPALHAAESDAARLSRALVEVGEVAAADLQLLQGRRLAEVEAAFLRVRERVSELHRVPGARALLLVYFAGRGEGTALELGPDRLDKARARALLAETRADVRLGFLNLRAGPGGAEVAVTAAPKCTLDLEDRLSSAGEAFLTAREAGEAPPESAGGFSNHLVAGLRGAADHSGDQWVTVEEWVRYAADRGSGGQPAAEGLRLAGQVELVMANLKAARTAVELPPRFEVAQLFDLDRGETVAQLDARSGRVVALAPGHYLLRAKRDGRGYAGQFDLDPSLRGSLGWEGLRADRADRAVVDAGPGAGGWASATLVPIAGEAEGDVAPIGITVLPVQVSKGAGASEGLAALLTQAVTAAIGRVDGLHLFRHNGVQLEPRELDELGTADGLSAKAREKLQRVPGAELVVIGRVSRTGTLVDAAIYLLDVPTGRVLDATHGARPASAPGGLTDELAREAAAAARTAVERRRTR